MLGPGAGATDMKMNRSEPFLPLWSAECSEIDSPVDNHSVMEVNLRKEKNAISEETAVCCREQGLALPSGRDLRKIFRKEGDV